MSKPKGTRNLSSQKAIDYFKSLKEMQVREPKKLVQGVSYLTESDYLGVNNPQAK